MTTITTINRSGVRAILLAAVFMTGHSVFGASGPDVQVALTDGVSVVAPGGTYIFTATVTNNGDQKANSITLTQQLPSNTTVLYIKQSGTANAQGLVTWPSFSLNAGATTQFQLQVQLNNPLPAGTIKTYTSTATAACSGDVDTGNNSCTVTHPIVACPDVAVAITDNLGSINYGPNTTMTYTVTIGNIGTIGATGIVATVNVPSNTSVVSGSISNGGFTHVGANGTQIIWPAFSLPGGDTLRMTRQFALQLNYPLTPGSTSTVSTSVSVDDDHSNGADSNPGNNMACDIDTINGIPPVCFDLGVTIDDALTNINPGATMDYTVVGSNLGNIDAKNVIIKATIPANTSVVPGSITNGGMVQGGFVVWPTISKLTAGSSVSYQFILQFVSTLPTPPPTNVLVTATISGSDANGDPESTYSNNSATDCDNVIVPPTTVNLSISQCDGLTACAPQGQPVNYVLTICNICTTPTTGVTVVDTIPPGTTYVSSSDNGVFNAANGTITWPAFSLNGGDCVYRTFVVNVKNPVPADITQLVNTATVTDDGSHGVDIDLYNNTTTLTNAICPPPTLPDIAVSKTVPTQCVTLGSNLTYTITAATQNAVAVTGVVITDTLPANTTFVSVSDGGTFANGVITFPGFALAGNSTAFRTITVAVASNVPPGVVSVDNTVTVKDDGTHGVDSNPSNNTYTLKTPICALTPPDLVIQVNATHVCLNQVDTYNYTLMVSNAAGSALTGVTVTDAIPENSTFVSASDNGTLNTATGIVTFPAFNLPANSIVLRTIVVKVAIPLTPPAVPISLINTASVKDDGASGTDINTANNSVTTTALVSNLHFVSDPTGNPNPAVLGVPEVFTASAQDDANPNAPITYTWNFGDGTTGTGTSVTHTYTSAGPFTINLTVTNGIGCGLGFTFTRDTAISNNPAVTCKLFRAPFNLTKPNADSLSLVAQLSLPKTFDPTGKALTVQIGGFSVTTTLDKQGKGTGLPKNESATLRVNGDLSILTLKVTKSSLRAKLAAPIPTTATSGTVPNQLFIIGFDIAKPGSADTFGSTLNLNYISNGKTGIISF